VKGSVIGVIKSGMPKCRGIIRRLLSDFADNIAIIISILSIQILKMCLCGETFADL